MQEFFLWVVAAVTIALLLGSVLQGSETPQVLRGPMARQGTVIVYPPPSTPKTTTPPGQPLYQICQLSKRYGNGSGAVDALRCVDVEIACGATAITGANGGGKSTLMNIIGGLETPTSGWVSYQGNRMPFDCPRELNVFRARIPAFVLQDLNLFQDQNALENVAFSLTRYGETGRFALEAAQEQLNLLGIDPKTAKRLPRQLSGGQRQRVAIARALLANKFGGAQVILADEPTAAVDSMDAERVFQLLLDHAREQSVPLIVVTHNTKLARLADRVLICEHGTIHEAGSEVGKW